MASVNLRADSGEWQQIDEIKNPEAHARTHVVKTDRVTVWHRMCLAQERRSIHLEPGSILYGVGGPCFVVDLGGRRALVRRRMVLFGGRHEQTMYFQNLTHLLVVTPNRPSQFALKAGSIELPATLYSPMWEIMYLACMPGVAADFDVVVEQLIQRAYQFQAHRDDHAFLRLLDRLHANWRVVPSLSKEAANMQLSPQYLARLFKKRLGVTLRDYGVLLRLDQARGMLCGSDMPISAVAVEVGFSDQSHLNRMLRKESWMTPRRLRDAAPCALAGRHGVALAED
jgi:AraC-like DNA-binding protein